jgi:aerobic-type carbon monoxide dehydrogenase small subunit (CoxS/CutS family)
MSVKFQVHGKAVSANAEPDTPLLWVIRDELGMLGKQPCIAIMEGYGTYMAQIAEISIDKGRVQQA